MNNTVCRMQNRIRAKLLFLNPQTTGADLSTQKSRDQILEMLTSDLCKNNDLDLSGFSALLRARWCGVQGVSFVLRKNIIHCLLSQIYYSHYGRVGRLRVRQHLCSPGTVLIQNQHTSYLFTHILYNIPHDRRHQLMPITAENPFKQARYVELKTEIAYGLL